ncbi:hypothetical protein ABB39_01105 [Levilactobacillus brevis]|uniref:hypothetical protein n=1 Tax=Levilactobacillus brevis TaxID=1580 RepID=UPI00076CEE53|nr:hypothetical protein [Levilactobacillus brevis]KWT52417.1 hypothetical protein ABB39_01105 [Levilactobacillus brevis]ORJ54187.1 hypothetical protein LBR_09700 [Levilactobacillus brevis]
MVKVYCKQPIEAEQFDGSEEMIDRLLGTDYIVPNMGVDDETESDLLFATKGGFLELRVGDWIATGVNGEHWPIADDVFRKRYAEFPVIPKGVVRWIELTKQAGKSLGDMFVDYTPEQLTDADEDMISAWVGDNKNQTILANTLARAWLDGYRVEAQHD